MSTISSTLREWLDLGYEIEIAAREGFPNCLFFVAHSDDSIYPLQCVDHSDVSIEFARSQMQELLDLAKEGYTV